MTTVHKPQANVKFDFSGLQLSRPAPTTSVSIPGGGVTYMAPLSLRNAPFYVQLPKAGSKQGVTSTKGGKALDLVYAKQSHPFVKDWFEDLQFAMCTAIHEQSNLWFDQELSQDDIEEMMRPTTRSFNSGQNISITTHIYTTSGPNKCMVYNEQRLGVDLDNIDKQDLFIPLVWIEGVRFNSKQFEVQIVLIQVMLTDMAKPVNTSFLIDAKESAPDTVPVPEPEAEQQPEQQPTQAPKLQADQANAVVVTEPEPEDVAVQDMSSIEETVTSVFTDNTVADKAEVIEQVDTDIKTDINTRTNTLTSTATNEVAELDFSELDLAATETVSLRKHNEVYYDIYKKALTKAKELRRLAVDAYLEARNIQLKYMLDEIEDSDDEDSDGDGDGSEEEEEDGDEPAALNVGPTITIH